MRFPSRQTVLAYLAGGIAGAFLFLMLSLTVGILFGNSPELIGRLAAIPTVAFFHYSGKAYVRFYSNNGIGAAWLYSKTIGGDSRNLVRFIVFWIGLAALFTFVDHDTNGQYGQIHQVGFSILFLLTAVWCFVVYFVFHKFIKNIDLKISDTRLILIVLLVIQLFIFTLKSTRLLSYRWVDMRPQLMLFTPIAVWVAYMIYKWAKNPSNKP